MATTKQPSLYEILGITPDADAAAIKKAYQRQSRRLHPDANPGMEPMFLMVQHAYQVLSDDAQRRAYDAEQNGQGPGSGSAPGGPTWGGADPGAGTGPEPGGQSAAGGAGAPGPDYTRADTSTGAGPGRFESVPAHMYDGPLPREAHNVDEMPWVASPPEAGTTFIHDTLSRQTLWVILGSCYAAVVVACVVGYVALLPALLATVLFGFWKVQGQRPWGKVGLATFIIGGGSVLLSLAPLTLDVPTWFRVITVIVYGLGFSALIAALICHHKLGVSGWWLDRQAATDGAVWGDPGQGLHDATEKFGTANVMDGIAGEKLTSVEVGYFLGQIPGVKIVNGLQFPGSKTADIDHAIVCGDKVALVDSKAWAPGSYTMEQGQEAIRQDNGNGTWAYRDTHMHAGATGMAERLQLLGLHRAQVRGFIVVHPKSLDQPTSLGSHQCSAYNKLVTSQQLLVELGTWFTEDPEKAGQIDRGLLSTIVASRK